MAEYQLWGLVEVAIVLLATQWTFTAIHTVKKGLVFMVVEGLCINMELVSRYCVYSGTPLMQTVSVAGLSRCPLQGLLL